MKILALDTSGPVAAVAIAEDRVLTGGFRLQYKRTHSETLMPMMEKMKELLHLDMSTIDAVAVASGPGSFTGLRIGAATAKGLAMALEVPLIPVPTLAGIANRLYGVSGLICPMLDARRGQVYTGIYGFLNPIQCAAIDALDGVDYPMSLREAGEYMTDSESRLELREIAAARPLPVEEICEQLDEVAAKTVSLFRPGAQSGLTDDPMDVSPMIFLMGEGVPVYLERIRSSLKSRYTLAPFHCDRQSAESIAHLAFSYYEQGRAIDPDSFVPEYLRPSQAERVRAEKLAAGRSDG